MRLNWIIDWPISLISILLLSIGILVIYSSSQELAIQQLLFVLVGMVIFLFISQFDYRILKNFTLIFYLFILIILVIVEILGIETRGSVRWIPLGIFNIQPSEFAKPALILLLSNFWANNLPDWRNIGISFLWTLPAVLLILKQPDLGSAMTIISIWLGLLLVSGISIKKIGILTLIIVFMTPISWFFLHDYQRQRVLGFLTPGIDPLGRGYNLIQSTIAVGSGGFFGRGLGRGTQSRLQFLPEFRTDFIFASISEELGFIGSSLIVILYFSSLSYILRISERVSDKFGFLIIFGTISMFAFQVFVNIGMNIGLLPITGITLPLISYGGSSLIATLLSLGMVASCARVQRGKRVDLGAEKG